MTPTQAEEARLLPDQHADGAGRAEQRPRSLELAAAVVREGKQREAQGDALRLADGTLARGLAQGSLEQRNRVVRPTAEAVCMQYPCHVACRDVCVHAVSMAMSMAMSMSMSMSM